MPILAPFVLMLVRLKLLCVIVFVVLCHGWYDWLATFMSASEIGYIQLLSLALL